MTPRSGFQRSFVAIATACLYYRAFNDAVIGASVDASIAGLFPLPTTLVLRWILMGSFSTTSEAAVLGSANQSTPFFSGRMMPQAESQHSERDQIIASAFNPTTDPVAAAAFTWQLAHSHYENFSVVSVLLPKRLRQDFCNIYAFCRMADDLGDELGNRDESLRQLDRFREETLALYAGKPQTIIFAALQRTITSYDIPIQPFLDLIDAFQQDQRVSRYDTFDQVVDYCRRSADPVGRLVLYMCGYRDEQRQRLSDRTCTALQLANFWQDVRRDLVDRDRIYLPRETMDRFGVTEQQLHDGRCDDNYRKCIQFEVDRTALMFDEGDALLPLLDETVRPQISLFAQGGRAILDAIRRQDYDTLSRRPSLSKWQKGRLVFGVLAARLRQAVELGDSPENQTAAKHSEGRV